MPRPLLIVSLGNPGSAYTYTPHSAGHILLNALRVHLGLPNFPSTKPERGILTTLAPESDTSSSSGGEGNEDEGQATWSLFPSPAYMNVSGPAVANAWRAWVDSSSPYDTKAVRRERGRLVLLHDELELDIGKVKRVKGAAGAKGHNGIRSVKGHLRLEKGKTYERLAIGIGRPQSRETGDVSRYVLRSMGSQEVEKLAGGALPGVLRLLGEIGNEP